MSKQLDKPFIWRGNDGLYLPEQMETTHLFYTLRMIWNHSAPRNLRMYPFKRYIFGEDYTSKYMSEAAVRIYNELMQRPTNHLADWQLAQLEFMQGVFRKRFGRQALEIMERADG